ncbi:3-phosphoserine/phosphohydroxythreonine transaminase [Lactobacillus sp. S2-2]|uniref:3-phosphoserine/phosphohydroxythreonine transaminase n=1 Tax=Lactobacillus sp. S2-2 TaxID=2692917 RepID=UPI001F02A9B5|nr:3-phosphoserine/phosphohydroxythreonine transaminase [Lactobacillus sp. S2-2]MCF6515889.1 3-phosphoserine/phosphohydroxythreonine transaminase [Lactobacillus sp. S2-2]
MTVYNFSAGPATLPDKVIKEIQNNLLSINESGMSILEISHRSKDFVQILEDAKKDLKDLMQIPDNYKILFFQGGGSGQFAAAPMNLANKHQKIALLDSGYWAKKAEKEAMNLGFKVDQIKSGIDSKYYQLPQINQTYLTGEYDYLHMTVNNTIEGTAYHEIPQLNVPIVGDMSSNFLAQEYNVSDFGMIFAGAQKNVGPAGVTIVIVREDLIDQVKAIPSILNYKLFIEKDSMYNTSPVFPIYACGLVLKWLKNDIGGIKEMEKINRKKATMLYEYLDQSKLFNNYVNKNDRSLTNVTFTTNDDELNQLFVKQAEQKGLKNLKGHRSIGGMRASLYNAMPIEGVKALIKFLQKFENEYTKGEIKSEEY